MTESANLVPFIIPEANTAHIHRKRFDLPYAHLSPAQKLDIYWPAEGNGPFPVIVSIHGGAFMGGDKRDVQITPMQIVRMTAAVASNGKLWEPRFVLRVQGADGVPTYQSEPGATDLGYTPTTYEAIRAAMCDVTLDENGTARFIFEEWYNYQATDIIVCGKTGTAQAGGETVKPHSWFTAFVPQDDPQIAITVLVENSCEGSEVAAPIVRRIIEDYYHMPQSEWPPLWQDECSTIGE